MHDKRMSSPRALAVSPTKRLISCMGTGNDPCRDACSPVGTLECPGDVPEVGGLALPLPEKESVHHVATLQSEGPSL